MTPFVDPSAQQAWQGLDSVYFFMWPGWRDQLESNRWHWGKRWAQRLPVVFIQPELAAGVPWRAEPEGRLVNVTVLSIQTGGSHADDLLSVGLKQAGQLAEYMNVQGHRRSLFWMYNLFLAPAYLVLPGSVRVFHGTENYFDFDGLHDDSLNLYRFAIEASDLVICCSSGVAHGVAAHSRCTDPLLIPNGCEYQKYRSATEPIGDWPRRIAEWRGRYRDLAVFAGNVDLRLDYELMIEIAQRQPDIGFIYAGPVDTEHLSAAQRRAWKCLLGLPNVRALGRLPPQDLPALYWTCQLGIIPYRTDMPILVENGFPLKALEMAAAGLPVVSSLMRPLQEVPEAVTVVDSPEAFNQAVASHSRRARPAAAREAAERVCRAFDYDVLFERMLGALAPRLNNGPPRPGNLADFVVRIGLGVYRSSIARLGETAAPPASTSLAIARQRIPLRYRVGLLLRIIPLPIRRLFPVPIRRLSRRWMA
jgi:glycosyltransferase involved in cell wall biosynthesis